MAEPLTPEDLAAIQERAEAATPEPWYGECGSVFNDPFTMEWIDNTRVSAEQRDKDMTFIAAARTDVPRLLAEVERLQKENEGLQRQLNSWGSD